MRSPSEFGREGACRDADPSIFFPSSGHPDSPAKKICASCSVDDECLDWALANPHEADGVWGETSQADRKRIRRRRRNRSAPPERGAAAS